MKTARLLLASVALWAAVLLPAAAQTPGQFPAGTVYGNSGAARAFPAPSPMTAILDRAFCGTSGNVLSRGASVWACSPLGSLLTAGTGITITGSTIALTVPVVVANGGTNCISASGTCLDNITGFSSAGFLNRTGAGAYALQPAASTAQWENNTAGLVLTTDQVWGAGAFPTITFGATTTIDLSTLVNGTITLTGNITTLNWNNCKAGQSGIIEFVQDATGGRTVPAAWNSAFRWAGGVRGVLSTAASSTDWLFYQCKSASVAFVSLQKGLAN